MLPGNPCDNPEPAGVALASTTLLPETGGPFIAMVTVEFAPTLRRHVDCAPQLVAPGALREVLEAALLAAPELASYVFDDQRAVRKHVAVFVNRQMVQDRTVLNQPLVAGDRVLVVQALSGG